MKRITALAIICLSFCQLIAQNLPQGIAYQAVAVKDGPYSIAGQNPEAIYWSNKDINVRFTIYEKYPGGANQYSETHATKTDDYGVFNLIIGQGNVISGDFAKIPWDIGTAHLQVEIDFDNNGTYKLTSLERFWSVPYAFVTRKSSSTSTDSTLNALNNKFNYLRNRDKDTVVGNEGGVSYKSLDSLNKVLVAKLAAIRTSDKDTIVGNELQKLTRNNDTLVLSDGGGKVTLRDEDPKNELQVLSRNKDTVMLSQNGGRFVLNDDDSKNEIQTISLMNDSVFLSRGGGAIALKPLLKSNSNIDTIRGNIFLSEYRHSVVYNGSFYYKSNFDRFNPVDISRNCSVGKDCYILGFDRYSKVSGIYKFETSNRSIYKIRDINSSLYNITFNNISRLSCASSNDSAVTWFYNKKFVVYNLVTDNYNLVPKSSSKYTSFFNTLSVDDNPATGLNQVCSFARAMDTITFVYRKIGSLDLTYKLCRYIGSKDDLKIIDSFTFFTIDNKQANMGVYMEQSGKSVLFYGNYKTSQSADDIGWKYLFKVIGNNTNDHITFINTYARNNQKPQIAFRTNQIRNHLLMTDDMGYFDFTTGKMYNYHASSYSLSNNFYNSGTFSGATNIQTQRFSNLIYCNGRYYFLGYDWDKTMVNDYGELYELIINKE
jgi:hypothetical protein